MHLKAVHAKVEQMAVRHVVPDGSVELALSDSDVGFSLQEHETWINEVLKTLKVGGVICFTGHPKSQLFEADTRIRVRVFLAYRKGREDDSIALGDSIPFYKYNEECQPEGWFLIRVEETKDRMWWFQAMKEIVVRHSTEGGLVLDLFSGRGTGAFAAALQGRCAVAVESDLQRIEAIRYRFERAKTEHDVVCNIYYGHEL